MMSSLLIMRSDVSGNIPGGGLARTHRTMGMMSRWGTNGCTLKFTNTPKATECQLLKACVKLNFHFGDK